MQTLKLFTIFSLFCSVVLSSPVEVRLNIPHDGQTSISSGPGLGGAPVLVDTRHHMPRLHLRPDYQRSRHRVRLTVGENRSRRHNDGFSSSSSLPVIRSATNVREEVTTTRREKELELRESEVNLLTELVR